jgi:RND family efflux transporter MFP subunit
LNWLRLAVVLAIAIATPCCRRSSSSTLEKAPRPVKVRAVESIDRRGDLRYSATVEADEQVAVAFKVGGYIDRIRQVRREGSAHDIDVGDAVRRGDELARVRQADYTQGVNQSRAQLEEADATLRKASEDIKRADTLFASGSATKPEVDAARLQYEAAIARQKAAQAAVRQTELTSGDTVLRAPLDGIVLARRVEQGTLAAPGQTAFIIGSIAKVKVVFGVPDTVVRRLRRGQQLSLTTEAFGPRVFTGQIDTIAPSADPQSRVFSVELSLANPGVVLKPGVIATVTVPSSAEGPATTLAVPLTAIVKPPTASSPDVYALYVAEGQGEVRVASLHTVTLGDVYGNLIAVTSGVSIGMPVIVSGATLVTAGDRVRIVP